jgi:hypothetical protein
MKPDPMKRKTVLFVPLEWKKHQVYMKLGAPMQQFSGLGKHPITYIQLIRHKLLSTQLWQQQSSGGAMSPKSLKIVMI